MRILLTGATGYIGKRLLPVLLEEGHEVICCMRNASNYKPRRSWRGRVSVFEVDFLEEVDIKAAPLEFDVAYYLIHSMSAAINDFKSLEERSALNFRKYIEQSTCRQTIYLTGIVNNDELSSHLESRLRVEEMLQESSVPLTALHLVLPFHFLIFNRMIRNIERFQPREEKQSLPVSL